MTSAFLQSELLSLISDSKKKFGDVRTAAEKSQTDLKAITVTSEIQLAADLARRPQFIDPFIKACQTKSPKLANSATACLQRLIASQAVPPDRLGEVLGALKDVVSTSYDVQLKILQTLPALLQLYSNQIHGELLARTLETCAILQGSKTTLVSSSAGATLWQLIASVFDSASQEQANTDSNGHPTLEEDGSISTSADDAGRLFEDFCNTLNQAEPTFIKIEGMSTTFLVETLSKVIEGHAAYIRSKPYLVEACRAHLIPAIAGLLDTRDDFPFLALLLNTSYILLQRLAPLLFPDMKPILSIILSFTERDGGLLWKRGMALEFLARMFSNFALVARLFDELRADRDNIVIRSLSTFVRIASEDPVLIGLGKQSTAPAQRGETREDDMAAIEAQGVGGGLASVTSADAAATGISLEYSTIEPPLLDAIDATKAASVPKTYIHTLILECISSFCEGSSKFIMPLSVLARTADEQNADGENTVNGRSSSVSRAGSQRRPMQKHKYQRLANPLNIKDLPQLPQVEACARMIDSCWPAVLAMCSTFLNAALDSHFYHVLIRSMQKLAQVSGTLDLGTPRDALLTSLAKGSVPPNAGSVIQLSSPVAKRPAENDPEAQKAEGLKSPTGETNKQLQDAPKQSLNVRHLLCLRALLNLGIALGPSLAQESWFIVIETLQQVEALMTIASVGRRSSETGENGQTTLTGEMAAVNTASKRMIDSTRGYSDDAFEIVAGALFRLMGDLQSNPSDAPDNTVASPVTLASPGLISPTSKKHGHKPSRSVSGLWVKTKALDIEVTFVFVKLRELALVNMHRFASISSKACTWDLVVSRLLSASKSVELNDRLRLQAAGTVALISKETFKLLDATHSSAEELEQLQCKSLEALAAQIGGGNTTLALVNGDSSLQADITKLVFEALEDILGHSGQSLRSGWKIVFTILSRSFSRSAAIANGEGTHEHAEFSASTPVAFRCVQLICNDFIESLDSQSLGLLVDLLYLFGSQQDDLNMALTTTSLLSNTTTLLQNRLQTIDVTEDDFSDSAESGNRQTGELQLWCSTLTELAKMCSDPRREVRDSSLRILLQTIEGCSGQLTSSSWGPLLEAIPFAISQDYQAALSQDDVNHELLGATAAHLLDGTTNLMAQNIEAMVKDRAFVDTWSRMIDIYNVTLEGGDLGTFALVYKCAAQLLVAVSQVDLDHEPFVKPALLLWTWHPVPEHQKSGRDESNQAALTAHLHMFVAAYATSPGTLQSFSHHRRKMSEYAATAIRQTLLTAMHPPYTSDVKTMASEQQEAIFALEILKVLFLASNELENFTGFTLELVQDMLDIEKGTLKPRSAAGTTSKASQKPTYIAVSSHCIDLLRDTIDSAKSNSDFANTMQLPYALDMLSAIIKTKYTSLPTNALAPLWRNATATAVMMLEAYNDITPSTSSSTSTEHEFLTDLAQTTTSTAAAILSSGGLPIKPSSTTDPSEPIIATDTAFDIQHFTRLHAAALPLIDLTAHETIRSYILALFHASLLSSPLPGDLPPPSSLLTAPLQNLTTLRPGSVRTPTFPRRPAVCEAALNALFALLDAQDPRYREGIAREAAGYVLLRLALPMKGFLADQSLRGWSVMPARQRGDLKGVLERGLSLRGWDGGFVAAVSDAGSEVGARRQRGEKGADASRVEDGRAHLRILYGLVLKTREAWRGAMRVPGARGWMEKEGGEGREIEALLDSWIEDVGQGWSGNLGAF